MPNKYTILVAEDEPEIMAIIRLRLENGGYTVLTATNGQEGLTQVKKEMPDLIITDVMMLEMDGFAFYKALKQDNALSAIPVLVLTSRSKLEDSFRVIGADEFIVKPFDHKELLEKIAHLLHRDTPQLAVEIQKKVLVAGNEDDVVGIMSVQLKKRGCEVDHVTTGAEVISRSVVFAPELIILDIDMYGMSAPEIVKVLKQMPNFDRIPILVYSYYRVSDLGSEDVRQKALSVDANQKACMGQGATSYIGRFNEATFLKSIEKYLL